MAETIIRNGKQLEIYDLSDRLTNDTRSVEPNAHHIEYLDSDQAAELAEQSIGIRPEWWPGGQGPAAETVTLSTHSGTHVDAPSHYGPAAAGEARSIDRVPLSWLFGNGVLLDMRHKRRGEGITRADVTNELTRIGHELEADDIVLVMTGASRRFGEPGYQNLQPGLRRDATEFLVDSGVHLIGIDAWGLDRPFDVMVEEAERGDVAQLWESHILGREKEYCQIERLAHLDELPEPHGFTVYAFPYKLERASAAWTRVVAIYERDPQ
jgi:kynurenine formamidase